MQLDAKTSLFTIALAGMAVQQAAAAPVTAQKQPAVGGVRPKPVTYWRYHPEDKPAAGIKLNARATKTLWRYHPEDKPAGVKRGWWEKVKGGFEDFGEGFVDGFNSEQDRNLAPEEGHSKRDVQRLRPTTYWRYHPEDKPAGVKRGWWEKVKGGFEDFGEGFVDGFNSEQDRNLAPEEGHSKRGFFNDVSNGFKEGFSNVGDDIEEGYQKIIHPVVVDRRDTFWDDAGNVVGAIAGYGQDHLGRISFRRDDAAAVDKRDSFWDDAGNVVGAIAGYGQDHLDRISLRSNDEEEEKRSLWDSIQDGAEDVGDAVGDGAKAVGKEVSKDAQQFGKGFSDGFKSEQKADLAPEEGHDNKRGFFDDVGNGLKKGFGNVGDDIEEGAKDIKESYKKLIHPVVARDSFWDDAGNVVGAVAGYGQDHLGRIDPSSLFLKGKKGRRDVDMQERDSFWDDAGNVVGAVAGYGQDHLGRIDPSSLFLKGKGRRDVPQGNDADLLA